MKSISELYRALGYIDPLPNAGRNNKKANKIRAKEKAKFNIKQYKIGSTKEYEGDGYFIVSIYEYKGIKYSSAY